MVLFTRGKVRKDPPIRRTIAAPAAPYLATPIDPSGTGSHYAGRRRVQRGVVANIWMFNRVDTPQYRTQSLPTRAPRERARVRTTTGKVRITETMTRSDATRKRVGDYHTRVRSFTRTTTRVLRVHARSPSRRRHGWPSSTGGNNRDSRLRRCVQSQA